MKAIYSPVLALFLLAAAGMPVRAAEQPVQSAAVADIDDEDVMTCEREGVTGSRVKKKTVCSSERTRREQRERTSEAMDDIRIQGTAQRANGS